MKIRLILTLALLFVLGIFSPRDGVPRDLVWCDHLLKTGELTFMADATGNGEMETWTAEQVGAHGTNLTIFSARGEELGHWFTDGGFACVHLEDETPLVAIRARHPDDPIYADLVALYRYASTASTPVWAEVSVPFRSSGRPDRLLH